MDLSKMRRASPDQIIDVRGQINPDMRLSILEQILRGGSLMWNDLFPNTAYRQFGLSDPQAPGALSAPSGVLTPLMTKKKK